MEIDKAVTRAIQINFDGQRDSLKMFKDLASSKDIAEVVNPI